MYVRKLFLPIVEREYDIWVGWVSLNTIGMRVTCSGGSRQKDFALGRSLKVCVPVIWIHGIQQEGLLIDDGGFLLNHVIIDKLRKVEGGLPGRAING